jgi:U32 family peptidase
MDQKKTEVSAPVGSWASFQAAIQAKADSLYFGIHPLNMRARASPSFTLKDLPTITKICKKEQIKSYLVLNTILYDHDLPLMRQICEKAKEAQISAVVASDMAAISFARSLNLSVHASTQLNVSNWEALRFFSQFVDTCILARELTLPMIASLCQRIQKEKLCGPSGDLLQIELFAHGALCVAIAGKCYMSLSQYNCSANRGDCRQVCRRKYRVIDEETGSELRIENRYVMSPKDLCTIDLLEPIVQAGVSILKIEGRGRSAEYVFSVVKTYKEALQSIQEKSLTQEKRLRWKEELSKVYHRGFWENGYYLGHPLGEWSSSAGSQASEKKLLVGFISHYYGKSKIAEAFIQRGSLKEKDSILILGKTTGALRASIENLQIHSPLEKEKIQVTFPLATRARKNDSIYLLQQR